MQKVLLVDQTNEIAEKIVEMSFWVHRKDFAIVGTVKNTKEMMALLSKEKVDIIFYTLHYETINEVEILENMKDWFQEIAIIIISYRSSYEDIRQGFLAGAFDYLVPPLEEEVVEASLNRIYISTGIHYIRNRLQLKCDALIEHIFTGGGKEQKLCMKILEQIYKDWNQDVVNSQMIADKTKAIIYEEIIARKPWLEKFIYKKNYIHSVGMHFKTKEQIQEEWKRYFADAAKMVKKYQMIDHNLIYPVGKYVVVHVDEKLTLEGVAQGVFLNKTYISHIFKKITNMNFMDFMLEVKVDRAKILLLDEEIKIYDVAAIIGYSNPEYFSKKFKEKTGMSPTDYRKKQTQ